MKKNMEEMLLNHFEGVRALRKQYEQLDHSLTKTVNELDLHCKTRCGACCLGAAAKKEASVFEMLPLAIELDKKGLLNHYLEKLRSYPDCSQVLCISYINEDQKKGLGHCGNYAHRPFICRLFGDSLYHVNEDKLDFTGCHWLIEKYKSNPHRQELHKRLPVIAETVMKGRCLNSMSFTTITDINSALKEALELVQLKHELLEEEENLAQPFNTTIKTNQTHNMIIK